MAVLRAFATMSYFTLVRQKYGRRLRVGRIRIHVLVHVHKCYLQRTRILQTSYAIAPYLS